MQNRAKNILSYSALIVVTTFFFFWGLVKAQDFLAPIAVAMLPAMILLPVSHWFEKKGIKRGWASFLSTIVILLFFVILAGVVTIQVRSLVNDWPQVRQKIEPRIEKLQAYISDKTGIPVSEQDRKIDEMLPGGGGDQNRHLLTFQRRDSSLARPSLVIRHPNHS